MTKSLAAFLIISFSYLLPILASELDQNLGPYQGEVIGKLTIVRKNVFDDEMPANPPFYYRWGNSLHIVTRDRVVRRELLFAVGDTLDLQRVLETERNLRAAGFIGEIEIVAVPDSSGALELVVTTTDLWTTKAEIFLGVAGGNYSTGVAFTEANLLGLGKYIQLLGQAGNDQDGYAIYYADSRLFGSRFGVNFLHSNFTYSRGLSFGLSRPQYSLSVPFGISFGYSHFHDKPRLFSGGDEIFRYRQDEQIVTADGVYSIGQNRRLNLSAGFDFDDTKYSAEWLNHPLDGIIPQDETYSFPSFGIGAATIRYDIDRFLDAAGSPEDLTLGASFKSEFGRSDESFGADYIGNYQAASAHFLARPYRGVFIGGADKVTWWKRESRTELIRHRSEFAVYYKPAETHLLTIHSLTDFAWRQKSVYQVVLGGGNGLRGYSFHEFAGNRLAMGNIEYRFYTPITILTVRLGAAVFFDIGHVWARSQKIELGDLNSGVGFGLRFGLTKASTSRVITLDFAKALSRDEFFIGFGTASIFNLKNFGLSE
jgi:hypothetical protein